jgi:phosphatidate cytidylyltransferase
LNNFTKRTLTATVFVAVLLGCTYYNPISFSVLFFLVTVLGVWEFYTLSEKGGSKPQKITGTIISALVFITNACVCMGYADPKILILSIPLFFLIFIVELYLKAKDPFRNIAFTILGIIYVALPFSLLNYINWNSGIYNYQLVFGIFFIIWSCDAGAYLVGSAIGKHKLFLRVSPGKTWEGSIGGAFLSYLVAYIISGWYTSVSRTDWMILATILVVFGTLGDLVKSIYKRSLNVKDSGTILPGHGGILDRFDSLIMGTPFVFTYLYIEKLFF